MKKILLIIFASLITSCYAQPEAQKSPDTNDFYKIITDYVYLQDVHKDLEQLRRHAQTAAKLLWLEKNQKNVELCREIVRRYLVALEKLPEYDEQKQAWKKAVQDFMQKNENQKKESGCYTAA